MLAGEFFPTEARLFYEEDFILILTRELPRDDSQSAASL
jgi:hypothetical protein